MKKTKNLRITWAELNVLCAMRGCSTDKFKEQPQRKTFNVWVTEDEIIHISSFRRGATVPTAIGLFNQTDDDSASLIVLGACVEVFPRDNPNRQVVSFSQRKDASLLPHAKTDGGENVLVIGDLHAPFVKKGYLEFCKQMYVKHKCSKVVFIGDLLDLHASSYHEHSPDGQGAGDELSAAEKIIAEFYEAFPVAKVCNGNHDSLPNRKAFSSGLSDRWIKSIKEVMKADGLDISGWEFAEDFIINGVLYTHGIARKARQRSQRELISVVQGHYHSESYYETFVSQNRLVFALQVGCGIDRHSYAMMYGRHFNKPQINVGIVKDDGRWALIEHMKMG